MSMSVNEAQKLLQTNQQKLDVARQNTSSAEGTFSGFKVDLENAGNTQNTASTENTQAGQAAESAQQSDSAAGQKLQAATESFNQISMNVRSLGNTVQASQTALDQAMKGDDQEAIKSAQQKLDADVKALEAEQQKLQQAEKEQQTSKQEKTTAENILTRANQQKATAQKTLDQASQKYGQVSTQTSQAEKAVGTARSAQTQAQAEVTQAQQTLEVARAQETQQAQKTQQTQQSQSKPQWATGDAELDKKLSEAGYDYEKGKHLAQTASEHAGNKNTQGWCLQGVRETLEKEGVFKKDNSDNHIVSSADQAESTYDNMENLTRIGELTDEQIKKLPPGVVVIYEADGSSDKDNSFGKDGHAMITTGDGNEASDHNGEIKARGTRAVAYIMKPASTGDSASTGSTAGTGTTDTTTGTGTTDTTGTTQGTGTTDTTTGTGTTDTTGTTQGTGTTDTTAGTGTTDTTGTTQGTGTTDTTGTTGTTGATDKTDGTGKTGEFEANGGYDPQYFTADGEFNDHTKSNLSKAGVDPSSSTANEIKTKLQTDGFGALTTNEKLAVQGQRPAGEEKVETDKAGGGGVSGKDKPEDAKKTGSGIQSAKDEKTEETSDRAGKPDDKPVGHSDFDTLVLPTVGSSASGEIAIKCDYRGTPEQNAQEQKVAQMFEGMAHGLNQKLQDFDENDGVSTIRWDQLRKLADKDGKVTVQTLIDKGYLSQDYVDAHPDLASDTSFGIYVYKSNVNFGETISAGSLLQPGHDWSYAQNEDGKRIGQRPTFMNMLHDPKYWKN